METRNPLFPPLRGSTAADGFADEDGQRDRDAAVVGLVVRDQHAGDALANGDAELLAQCLNRLGDDLVGEASLDLTVEHRERRLELRDDALDAGRVVAGVHHQKRLATTAVAATGTATLSAASDIAVS